MKAYKKPYEQRSVVDIVGHFDKAAGIGVYKKPNAFRRFMIWLVLGWKYVPNAPQTLPEAPRPKKPVKRSKKIRWKWNQDV